MNLSKLPKQGHARFGYLLGFLLLLILIRYAFQVDIPRVVLLAVIALIALLGDRNEIIAACISFIPMHEAIDFYYALTICMSVYIMRYYKEFRIGYSILLVFLVCIWETLHCFQLTFSIIDFLAYLVPFIIITVLMATNVEHLDYPFLVRVFALSTLGIILILFVRVLFFANFNIALALLNLKRLGSDVHSGIQNIEVSGGQIHPNSVGIITVLASTGIMQLRRLGCSKTSDMILMGCMILFSALSASRTYLVCLALMFLLLIFSEKGGMTKKLKLIALICVAITVLATAMAIFFPSSFEYYVSRFLVDDITTGRDDLMTDYHRFIVSSPKYLFFGIGLQDYGDKLIQVYRVAQNVPHNFIQEIVVAWGIPGVIFFGMLFINMHRASLRYHRNQSLINWIPMIIILVKSLAGQMLTSGYTLLALAFAYLSLCQDFSSPAERSEQLRL